MQPRCPSGHEFNTSNVDTSLPTTASMSVKVKAIHCRICGYVYGVVRVGENE